MKSKLLGYYDYTVILTYCGMLFAFYGILLALSQSYWESVFCLMLAGICDMFDGAVAATKTRNGREKRFGIQIDSLSDLISFGVFPGIFVYIISNKNALIGLIASVYVLCALIRLAYFNVLEEERQQAETGKRKWYLGLPVTSIALILPAFFVLGNRFALDAGTLFAFLLIIVAVAFISPVRIKKPYLVGKIGIVFTGVVELIVLLMGMGLEV